MSGATFWGKREPSAGRVFLVPPNFMCNLDVSVYTSASIHVHLYSHLRHEWIQERICLHFLSPSHFLLGL